MSEEQALKLGLSGMGVIQSGKNGVRIIDLVLGGNTPTSLPSLRDAGSPPPVVKLRRYETKIGASAKKPVVVASGVGVDLEAHAFETLVQATAKAEGLTGSKAVSKTMTDLLDAAAGRQKLLEKGATKLLSKTTPDGIVVGRSRARDGMRIDDYESVQAPGMRKIAEGSDAVRQTTGTAQDAPKPYAPSTAGSRYAERLDVMRAVAQRRVDVMAGGSKKPRSRDDSTLGD